MNWKRRIHYNLWFLSKGWRIHLLSLSLSEEQALSLSLSLSLPLSLSLSDYYKILYMILRYFQWMEQVRFYRLSDLHQLASRVASFAMASWGYFTSGFVTRHLLGDLAALTRLASNIVRHGELLTSLLAFSSPLRVGGVWSLVLSGISRLSTRHCEFVRLSLAIACWRRVTYGAHCLSFPLTRLSSPITRHGE